MNFDINMDSSCLCYGYLLPWLNQDFLAGFSSRGAREKVSVRYKINQDFLDLPLILPRHHLERA